jgi:hypothetical protein
MADGQYLYISASWADSTESIAKKQWEFDGSAWSQSGNEDRFAFIWDMGLNGADGPSCVTMCHGDGLMRTNVGKVDAWHWKSARGNAIGYTDDKNWLTDDRHSDPGTSAYSDNLEMGSGYPTYMTTGDPGANVDFLANSIDALNAWDPFGVVAAHTVDIAVDFDSNATFSTGSVIPGYLHRIPDGDRASVQSAGKYENGIWTVEFKRVYAGGDNDFSVVPGSIYTLDFSMITGVIEQPNAHNPSKFELKQNYPNPFNPTTIIEFNIPIKGFVSLQVYNVLGQLVKTLVEEEMQSGKHYVEFNAPSISSGIYFYTLTTNEFSQMRKMIFMK